ncbi:MAG: Rpn family recombination-promoting nuclease/putative transposase [Myxococcaceae bacterium]|nr:MAG: Rpn family recombination-promoting nuclease/putative transposase [Myxococcaceae bacterium]
MLDPDVMRPVFADPKTDFVFKKLFGTEEHKHLLIALLNALLELPPERAVVEVTFLREEERPRVEELKFSVVDVKVRDARGTVFVVEMQVLQVEGFQKRVVYNASKAYVAQLARGDEYPELDDVIAISICDFELWPRVAGEPEVPLVSHWRMQEQHGGRRGLAQIQYVFVELPKLPLDRPPGAEVEEWAYLFRRAAKLSEVPTFLHSAGPRAALDAARTAHFSSEEWEAYDRVKVAEQDARGALSFARAEGKAEGKAEGRAEGRAEGELAVLERIIERRLGRALTEAERGVLGAQQAELGADGVSERALEGSAEDLARWLSGSG